jgi:hypothetical protein
MPYPCYDARDVVADRIGDIACERRGAEDRTANAGYRDRAHRVAFLVHEPQRPFVVADLPA